MIQSGAARGAYTLQLYLGCVCAGAKSIGTVFALRSQMIVQTRVVRAFISESSSGSQIGGVVGARGGFVLCANTPSHGFADARMSALHTSACTSSHPHRPRPTLNQLAALFAAPMTKIAHLRNVKIISIHTLHIFK